MKTSVNIARKHKGAVKGGQARGTRRTARIGKIYVTFAPKKKGAQGAKSHVYNHGAVYKWRWGYARSLRREYNIAEQDITEWNRVAVYKWRWGYVRSLTREYNIVEQDIAE
jgi:hypothetical protein